MAEVEIPPYFLCPITLDIMKDPVIISTGITYDRDSIENWIFSLKNNTCPVTKQSLFDTELIPNITLRRLIQSWCILNASHGVQRLPTPKPPISKSQLLKLLNDAKSPQTQMNCLQRLKSISSQNQTNKRCMELVGTPEFLSFLIAQKTHDSEPELESKRACDEALSILYSLQLSEPGLKSIIDQEFVESLTRIMNWGGYESRAYAVMLLESILEIADPDKIIVNTDPEFFSTCAQILKDDISKKATKATLKVLISVCRCRRNIIKSVEAGSVNLLIDLLLDYPDKRACELMLVLLDLLCQCAEGRAELLNHSAGLSIVSTKILKVSGVASEKAVKILYSISRFSGTPGVLKEMLQIGVVEKLCLVIQVDCGIRLKERIREMLKLHSRAWRNSSCIPDDLICSYPS